MSDNKETPPVDTADVAEQSAEAARQAAVGVKDRGQPVTGFGGERISGILADIADGDS